MNNAEGVREPQPRATPSLIHSSPDFAGDTRVFDSQLWILARHHRRKSLQRNIPTAQDTDDFLTLQLIAQLGRSGQ